LGSARGPRAVSGGSPETSPGAQYTKRHLPHFERPWGKYAITFRTRNRVPLSPEARQIVLDCLLHWKDRRYNLYAACVMPDHVHILIEPQIKEDDAKGDPIFFSLTEILHTIKSFTAHQINELQKTTGRIWEKESFDRLVRSERDLQEKFQYITRNPRDSGIIQAGEDYPWVWWPEREFETASPASRPAAEMDTPAACAPQTSRPQMSGEFAFKLYDTYGFPLDLTELMARERGLTVDVAGFEKLMDDQRERARKAQKKEAISVEEWNLQVEATKFLGYDFLETEALIETVLPGKKPDELNIVLDRTPFYAEMGGQVGDRGLLHVPGHDRTEVGQLRVIDTQKRGDVFIHRAKLTEGRAPEPGEAVRVSVDADRRTLIQGHHTVTHLLHWALHEIVSRDASQKGSYVGPDKLTFDFSSAALTKQQVRDVEKLVNEKIAENAPVSWTEILYAEVRKRKDVIQFFGEKYGDTVRVLQIGGTPRALNGYSMELCGGTHVRSTNEIGPFRIVKEEAIAAGIRRIEAVAGDAARNWAEQEAARQREKFATLARKKSDIAELHVFESNANTAEMLKQVDARAAYLEKLESEVREWEKKSSKAAGAELKSRAAQIANQLAASHAGKNSCVSEVPNADGKLLQAIVDALKPKFNCPIFLAGVANGRVALIAAVPKELTSRFQADKIIQKIAPIVGGKGGGRPESAQGGGPDVSKIDKALAEAKKLVGQT
jgi:alanyl-tRNA synthetase